MFPATDAHDGDDNDPMENSFVNASLYGDLMILN